MVVKSTYKQSWLITSEVVSVSHTQSAQWVDWTARIKSAMNLTEPKLITTIICFQEHVFRSGITYNALHCLKLKENGIHHMKLLSNYYNNNT